MPIRGHWTRRVAQWQWCQNGGMGSSRGGSGTRARTRPSDPGLHETLGKLRSQSLPERELGVRERMPRIWSRSQRSYLEGSRCSLREKWSPKWRWRPDGLSWLALWTTERRRCRSRNLRVARKSRRERRESISSSLASGGTARPREASSRTGSWSCCSVVCSSVRSWRWPGAWLARAPAWQRRSRSGATNPPWEQSWETSQTAVGIRPGWKVAYGGRAIRPGEWLEHPCDAVRWGTRTESTEGCTRACPRPACSWACSLQNPQDSTRRPRSWHRWRPKLGRGWSGGGPWQTHPQWWTADSSGWSPGSPCSENPGGTWRRRRRNIPGRTPWFWNYDCPSSRPALVPAGRSGALCTSVAPDRAGCADGHRGRCWGRELP